VCLYLICACLFRSFRKFEDRGRWWTFSKKREVRRWSLTLITGVITGAVAFLIAYFTKTITTYKMSIFYALIEREMQNELGFGSAFLFLLAANIGLGVLAWWTVYIEPLSAGSGEYL
jgi:hypothetical protein